MNSFQPGQHIRVQRFFYWHHGIFMGMDRGRPVVAELAKPEEGGKVRRVWFDAFSRGNKVEVVHHENGVPLHRVVQNARRAMGLRYYDLMKWNCEHFATWCSTHQVRSSQIEDVSLAAFLLAGCWFLSKLRPNSAS